MDMMCMVSSILATQVGNVQTQVATSLLKSNADAEKSAVETLLGGRDRAIAGQSRPRHRRQPRYFGLKSPLPTV